MTSKKKKDMFENCSDIPQLRMIDSDNLLQILKKNAVETHFSGSI